MDDPQSPPASDYHDSDDEQSGATPYTLTVPLLVALTTASGGNCPRDDAPQDFPTALWEPGEGIAIDLTTNDRFRRVLDALASLCVSRPRKQVFAIGVQITKTSLTLTITDNQPVKDVTIKYLEGVWKILKGLSDLYAGQRISKSKYHPSGVPWSKYVGLSPNMPRSVAAAEITLELGKTVYDFTRAKNLKRWAKRWDPPEGNGLLHFSRKFRAQKGSGSALSGKDAQFEMMFTKLNIAIGHLRCGKQADWSQLLGYMNDATDVADELLADKYWCEILAMDITCEFPTPIPTNLSEIVVNLLVAESSVDPEPAPGIDNRPEQSTPSPVPDATPKPKPPPYPLRRHIEKLTSHHRYFRALLAFTHSPRLRLAFTLAESVKTVSLPTLTPTGVIALPTSATSWTKVLHDLCAEHQFQVQEERAKPIIDYLESHHHHASVPHQVHSECALVAQYDLERTSSVGYAPPFAYIGVSKLSCKPCHLWLSAYNACPGAPRFYTRGSHGKWYFPWSPPTIAGWNPGLEPRMESACLGYLGVRGVLRSASDSTVASGGDEMGGRRDRAEGA